jgi:hypothetical protein
MSCSTSRIGASARNSSRKPVSRASLRRRARPWVRPSRRPRGQRQRDRNFELAALAMAEGAGAQGAANRPARPGRAPPSPGRAARHRQRGPPEPPGRTRRAEGPQHGVLQHRILHRQGGYLEGAAEPGTGAGGHGKAVTSRPRSRTRPASGASAPQIWAISVDFPAPFGPISAWISPGTRVIDTLSVAVSAPKRRVRPRVSRTGSAMRRAAPQIRPTRRPGRTARPSAAAHPADVPVIAEASEPCSSATNRHPRHRAEQPRDAAEDDEDHDLARHLPAEHRRADEAVEIGEQRARRAR